MLIDVSINGRVVTVEKGATILEAAKKAQIKIPTLCKHEDLVTTASCGMCIVKVKGMRKMVRACAAPAEGGMEVVTHDAELYEIRKNVLELILSRHPNDCLTCLRSGTCELQALSQEFGIRTRNFEAMVLEQPIDVSTKAVVLDPTKCVGCGRCAEVCQNIQNVWALEFLDRGFEMRIAPAGDILLADSPCVKCGQCAAHCPVGAITDFDETNKVWDALRNPELFAVAQIAPAVRVAFGEGFGLSPGEVTTKKIYALLRRLGFKAVFDTNFGADLTIVEEGTELLETLVKHPGKLPLVTSCCPAWIDYLEKYYPDLIEHFSTAKSPHQMVGVLAKTYYAEKSGIDPAKIFMASIMPCTAKKWEISRTDEMFSSGYQDIDVSLTTRELVRMALSSGIQFADLTDEEPDMIMGEYTGAGTIFGATGGVMEAAVRTAYCLAEGKPLENIELNEVRGLKGVKTAVVNIKGKDVRIAVAHGLANVKALLDPIREAKKKETDMPYDFIEVMACEGGCVAGGGQPYMVSDEMRRRRAEGLYKDDRASAKRMSHENPMVQALYKDFLGRPLGEKAHKLLHTKYKARPIYYK
ncbi:MAG TPA: 2Fe-2S iron-sulfur cluster binding domain-containing protein [bacterium]|nr:2Fe-2S iron-sulfur cluster binding domain-containing protein [bacterium]